mgnify:FL=1
MKKLIIGISALLMVSCISSQMAFAVNTDDLDTDIAVEPEVTDGLETIDGDSTNDTYTITYDKQGYTGGSISDEHLKAGETTTISKYRCVREGYSQAGWTDGEKDYLFGEEYTMPNHDVTFTPVWKGIYSVTYDLSQYPEESEGHENEAIQPDTCEDDTFYLSNATLVVEGYMHYGWSDGENVYKRNELYTMPAHDVIFTPYFCKYYMLYYVAGDVTGLTGNTSVQFERYETNTFDLATNDRFSRKGYSLTGWLDTETGETYKCVGQYTMPSRDVTMQAVWTAKDITITYSSDSSTETIKDVVPYESEYTFPECTFTKSGYKFVGWLAKDVVYQAGQTINMDLTTYKLSVSAVWEEDNSSNTEPTTETTIDTTAETTIITEDTTQTTVTSETIEPTVTTSTTSPVHDTVLGDANEDGKVTTADLLILKKYLVGAVELSSQQAYLNADANSDGKVTTADLLILKKYLLGILNSI